MGSLNWYLDYEAELAEVFSEVEAIINKFPQPLNYTGLSYLNGFNVLKDGSSNNYICYLLPFWMMDILPMDRKLCNRLSVANVLGMLYFFIQDDQMDSSSLPGKYQLPLANLLHMKFLESYQELFPTGSPFWSFYSIYITDWAEAVSNEGQAHHYLKNPLLMARKASPLKLCSTGACLLMEQPNLIPIVSDAIDHVLATLQMADDWVDWQVDLLEENYNSLIDFIISLNPIEFTGEINESFIKEAIYTKTLLTPFVDTAVKHQKHLAVSNHVIPHLLSFHDYIVKHLLEEASTIEKNRDAIIQGGFHYWMSNALE